MSASPPVLGPPRTRSFTLPSGVTVGGSHAARADGCSAGSTSRSSLMPSLLSGRERARGRPAPAQPHLGRHGDPHTPPIGVAAVEVASHERVQPVEMHETELVEHPEGPERLPRRAAVRPESPTYAVASMSKK